MSNIFDKILEKPESLIVNEKQLCSGIFWILSDNNDLSDHKILAFDIPCDINGIPDNPCSLKLNAKSGITYNHKKTWDNEIKTNNEHRSYNKKDYDYYPRGRIHVTNNKAIIYINPSINQPKLINEIKQVFGLSVYNIAEVEVKIDGSSHYRCFLD